MLTSRSTSPEISVEPPRVPIRCTRQRLAVGLLALGLLGTAFLLVGCRRPLVAHLRGVVVVSIDTLRADHLPCYGYRRDTAPVLCSLAESGVLAQHAVSQYPGTLPSHMSLFTGLYPSEHAVFPPDSRLSADLVTLPEIFRASGFRTAGFTEAGNVKGYYGFARGFEVFSDDNGGRRHTVADTFARGRAFLEGLTADDRFFLFLHTYEVHTPYEPSQSYRELFWHDEPPLGQRPTARRLDRFNHTSRTPSRAQLAYLEAMYDASIRQVDDQIGLLMETLETTGHFDDTLLVVLSDHGEEFWEHGMLMHYQLYPETLSIPLILYHPASLSPYRLMRPVELVDVAPTLLELAGLPGAGSMSGESFAGEITSSATERPKGSASAFAERTIGGHRTLFREIDGVVYQLIAEYMPEGLFLGRAVSFDLPPTESRVMVRSLGEPRRITVFEPGRPKRHQTVTAESTAITFATADETRRIVLVTDACTELSNGCFSLELLEPGLTRFELYDLETDPSAKNDIARSRPTLLRRLLDELEAYDLEPRRPAETIEIDEQHRRQLEALGYVG